MISPILSQRSLPRLPLASVCSLLTLFVLTAAPAAHAQHKKNQKASKSQESQSDKSGPKGLDFTAIAEPAAHTGFYAHSYAIIIGISHYSDSSINLKYAAADADALKDMLIDNYDFPKENVTVLKDEKATRKNIEDALSEIKNQKKYTNGTRVVFYFSGHGQTVKDKSGLEQGFLIPYDEGIDLQHPDDEEAYMKTCIRMDTLWGKFTDTNVKLHALLIADACYGGLLTDDKRDIVHGGNATSNRPSDPVIAKNLSQNALEVMTAGTEGETVIENSAWGHGAFTYELLKALDDKAKNPNTVFPANELATRLRNSVQELTKARQTPKFGQRDFNGEVLFYTADAKFPDKSGTVIAGIATPHPASSSPQISDEVEAGAFDFSKIAGLKLTVQPEKDIDPKDYQKGAEVRFLVKEELKDSKGHVISDSQGQPIIPKDTPVIGHVLSSYNPVVGGNLLEGYKNGHEGQLTVSCDYILVNSRKIELQEKDNTRSIGGPKASLTDFNIFGKGKRRMKRDNTFIDVRISEGLNSEGHVPVSSKDE